MSQVFGTVGLVQILRNEGVPNTAQFDIFSPHTSYHQPHGHLVISGERTNSAAAAKEAAATEQQLADGVLRLTLPFDTEKVTRYHIKIR